MLPAGNFSPRFQAIDEPDWHYVLPEAPWLCLNRGHQFNTKSLNGRRQESGGQSVMFAVPGAYHNTQGQWRLKKGWKNQRLHKLKLIYISEGGIVIEEGKWDNTDTQMDPERTLDKRLDSPLAGGQNITDSLLGTTT